MEDQIPQPPTPTPSESDILPTGINTETPPVNPIPTIETPPVIEPPKPKNNLVSILIVILILIILGAVGIWAYQNYFAPKQVTLATPTPSPTEASAQEGTAGWKTYSNSQLGFEFKSPNSLKSIDSNGSVTVDNKTYKTKQFTEEDTQTMSDVVVRVIYGWTKPEIDPYGNSTFAKQNINGSTWHTAYTENVTNEPGCFNASAHILTADQKNTIELSVYEACPSDITVKKSLHELNQILSTFKFTDQTSDTPTVTSPIANSKVSSPLTITGTVPTGWMFEGSFPIKLVDSTRTLIAQGTAKEVAPGSWQSTKPVAFFVSLPFSTTDSSGFLILMNDNPSGDQSKDKTFEVPIKF